MRSTVTTVLLATLATLGPIQAVAFFHPPRRISPADTHINPLDRRMAQAPAEPQYTCLCAPPALGAGNDGVSGSGVAGGPATGNNSGGAGGGAQGGGVGGEPPQADNGNSAVGGAVVGGAAGAAPVAGPAGQGGAVYTTVYLTTTILETAARTEQSIIAPTAVHSEVSQKVAPSGGVNDNLSTDSSSATTDLATSTTIDSSAPSSSGTGTSQLVIASNQGIGLVFKDRRIDVRAETTSTALPALSAGEEVKVGVEYVLGEGQGKLLCTFKSIDGTAQKETVIFPFVWEGHTAEGGKDIVSMEYVRRRGIIRECSDVETLDPATWSTNTGSKNADKPASSDGVSSATGRPTMTPGETFVSVYPTAMVSVKTDGESKTTTTLPPTTVTATMMATVLTIGEASDLKTMTTFVDMATASA